MFRNVCPVAIQNKLAHQAFLCRIEKLASGEERSSSSDLLEFLKKWIAGHILAVDRRMNECVDSAESTW